MRFISCPWAGFYKRERLTGNVSPTFRRMPTWHSRGEHQSALGGIRQSPDHQLCTNEEEDEDGIDLILNVLTLGNVTNTKCSGQYSAEHYLIDFQFSMAAVLLKKGLSNYRLTRVCFTPSS